MESPQTFFDPPPSERPAPSLGLALAAQPGQPVPKAQQTFNRLVDKIEKLRAKLERETHRLDEALAHFGREIHPRQQRQTALRKEMARALAPFLDERRLKTRERAALREILANQLDLLSISEGGLAGEELRDKNIASIYKQLAKLLHPDLEPDPARKQHKSVLMQELTTAHRQNDLHTLLRLELEWIRGEHGDASHLTGEKLAVFNQVLREQVRDLEYEIFTLPRHPRYQPLAGPMGPPFARRLQTDGAAEAARLDAMIASIEQSLARLRSPEALQEVRDAIATHRRLVPDRF